MAKAPIEIRSLARTHTEGAIKTLASIMRDDDHPAAARVAAAVALLDRGWGKPEQSVEVTTIKERVIRAPQIASSAQEWSEKNKGNGAVH